MRANSLIQLFAMAAAALSAVAAAADVTKPADYLTLHKVNDLIYTMRAQASDVKPLEIDMSHVLGQNEADGRARRFGCSAVTNGRYYGRNLDYFRSNHPVFVVWVDRGEGTAAYMGVTASPQLIMNIASDMSIGKPDVPALQKHKELLMSMTADLMDGVNEHGVACNINMIDAQDSNLTDKGTKPGAPRLLSTSVVQFILSRATSAHHAVKLLEEMNIVFADNGPTLHWMISDPDHTYVVEVKDDKMHVTDQHKVMTNYYVTTPEYTPHSCGIERADLLRRHRAEATSVEGMRQLMRRAAYSQSYSWNTTPFWYSEFYDNPQSGMHFSLNTPHDNKDFLKYINASISQFEHSTHTHNPWLVWETSYTSVYDMAEKTLRLTTCEQWDEFVDFKL